MNKKKWLMPCAALAVMVAILVSLAMPQTNAVADAANDQAYYGKKAKYVFYFIGDGMALSQINSTEIFKGTQNGNGPMGRQPMNFTAFSHQGVQRTQSADTFITESAAAGTALATGNKTNNDILGMDPTKSVKFKTMAEMAKEKGMKVGIVSSVSLDHATPGAFYAHQPTRKNYYEIGQEMINSNFDYFAGGGLLAPTGKKKDQPNLLDIAKQKGYQVALSIEEIQKIGRGSGKTIAIAPNLAAEEAMSYEIDRGEKVSLAEFTRKGIEVLDNQNGFFMMVEGGKVDWACHANDAATTVKDVMAFEEAIAEALKFYAKHPDETLIVVTGDHETGGMTIGFAGTGYKTFFSKLGGQTLSYEEFDKQIKTYRDQVGASNANLDDWLPALANQFGMNELTAYEKNRLAQALAFSMIDPKKRPADEETTLAYGPYEPFSVTVTHLLNQRAGIGWTTYAHTGVAVPVYAQGTGSGVFDGYYDNTDVAKKMMNIMGVSK
ncbi:MAG: alkaline phosphatase [Anaeromusa sp.]|uniref:alkaline phosphatase n=1 Tax=Anaeromusa sp. TaxID=1872520 RepID=UPI002B215BDD|nr:alkaline phosphatase [Anaeromusa sp.]MEA4833581.1 alkaline phosphatase [Anaeromusa sp.]